MTGTASRTDAEVCRTNNWRRSLPVLAACVIGALATAFSAAASAAEPTGLTTAVERGRYLAQAGGCISCHTADRPDARPLAGGRAIKTDFGTFYTPNLTPDPETGLNGWTEADVGRALREGVSPDNTYYYPAFPYPSYTGLTDGDVSDIAAYLQSLAPLRQATTAHELPWYLSSRLVMFGWNLLNFTAGRFTPDPARDEAWNRGAYLVRHVGHCGECHTPRNALGGLDHSRELSGNPAGPEGKSVPDITQDPESGIGSWSADDIVFLLETGLLPDGDFAGSTMSDVINDSTGKLAAADREAIADYLKSVEPAP